MTMAKRLATIVVVVAILSALGFYFYPSQSQEPAEPPRPHKVTLNWEKTARAVSYNIYRGPYLSDTFEKLGSSATTTYEDPAAMSEMRYCYAITAVDAKGRESAKSKEMCVTVPHP
jgi:fibronectin type 3 domain-containing protein